MDKCEEAKWFSGSHSRTKLLHMHTPQMQTSEKKKQISQHKKDSTYAANWQLPLAPLVLSKSADPWLSFAAAV
jgi:hypothetical protein